MPSITVRMPYIPDLTANHCHGVGKNGRPYLKTVVKTWRLALACEIRQALGYSSFSGPLVIRIDWEGPQEPDQDGRCKSVWDAVQQATGINDREYICEAGGYTRVPAHRAEITITIRWGDTAAMVARALEAGR